MNVTRSDYYYHTKNPINSYKEANQKLDVEIKRVYDDSKGRYGSPKITKQLKNEGIKVSQKRVARRMKILGLRSIVVKKYNHAGSSKTDSTKEYSNLLEQNFFADKPSEKWVGDITYIYTNETGWTYLAIVMDLFEDYSFEKARLVLKEMVELGSLRLIENNLVTDSVGLYIGYSKDIIKATGGTKRINNTTNVYSELLRAFLEIYDKTTNRNVEIRRIGVNFANVVETENVQLNLFTDQEKIDRERKLDSG